MYSMHVCKEMNIVPIKGRINEFLPASDVLCPGIHSPNFRRNVMSPSSEFSENLVALGIEPAGPLDL
jgi:hypothetical protein